MRIGDILETRAIHGVPTSDASTSHFAQRKIYLRYCRKVNFPGFRSVATQPPLTALRYIRRVLVPGGRLAFTVWSEAYPIVAETMNAVRRHVGDDAAADILVAYSWTDANHIQTLVAEAGFNSIEIQHVESRMQWPALPDGVAEFLVHAAARSPDSPYARALMAAHAVMVEEVYAAL